MNHETYHNQYYKNLETDLCDTINEAKNEINVGDVLKRKINETVYEEGKVIQKFEHFAFCRSTNDQYNLSFSWNDIAMGKVEVVR